MSKEPAGTTIRPYPEEVGSDSMTQGAFLGAGISLQSRMGYESCDVLEPSQSTSPHNFSV